MIKGTLKATGLALSKLEMNFLVSPIEIKIEACFVDETTGRTLATARANGAVFSKDTLERMRALQESIEGDLAKAIMVDVSKPVKERDTPSGLGEYLSGVDAPSI